VVAIDAIGINNAAQRIGVTPPYLDSIYKYVEDTIVVGMSQQEVETNLQGIAPIDVHRAQLNERQLFGCDRIKLRLGSFLTYFDIQACYDDRGRLLHFHVNSD
jgi:hypothetical protein